MVSNFFVSASLALCAGEFPGQRPVTRSSSELISYIPTWYGQQLVFIADLWYFLGKQWKCKNENVSNRIQTPTPWICVVPFELPRYHILGSMKLGIYAANVSWQNAYTRAFILGPNIGPSHDLWLDGWKMISERKALLLWRWGFILYLTIMSMKEFYLQFQHFYWASIPSVWSHALGNAETW